MKRCLRKVLGQSRLTEEQLNTTLISIEAAVNSRPITQGDDSGALTPAHFLTGEGLATVPTGSEPTARQNLAKEFRLKQKLSDDFWKRWTRVSVRTEKFPRSSSSSREDHPTPPRRRRPNLRGRSPRTLVGTGTHRGVAEGT